MLIGLGGAGKTQVAVDYAETMWATGQAELLVWVTGGSRKAIVSSYARLVSDLTGLANGDPDVGAERLLEWLAGTQVRWLVVLDDVTSPGDVRGLWPPTTPNGRVVVTTRRRDAAFRGHGRQLIDVDVFTADQAHVYLETTFAERPELVVGAALVAADLGFLPLALAQAAAYMLDRGISCAAYRTRLADRRRSLGELLPDRDGLPDDQRVGAAAAWSLSVEQANQLAPVGVAGPLLEVASFLDPNGIPAEVFSTEPVAQWLVDRVGPVQVHDALDGSACLQRLSLVTLDHRLSSSKGPMVRLHALVQRAAREATLSGQTSDTVQVAARALLQAWSQTQYDAALVQVLAANTDALIRAGSDKFWKLDGRTILDLLLASGERANLEIKQQIPNSELAHRNCMRTLAALANSGGGIVLLGVADDGEVVGIEPDIRDRSLALLGNLIRSSIQPELIYELREIEADGRMILLIEVMTGTPPYRVISMGSTVYVRTDGATTVPES